MISISLDKAVQRNFDKAWNTYVLFNRRLPSVLANQTCLFVARNAVNTTPTADKDKIQSDLMKGSKLNPSAPIAAILVNKRLGEKGESGLNGNKMSVAVNAFIRQRQNTRNFLRAGWLPAIKQFSTIVKNKKGAARIPSIKMKGQPKGGGKPAREGWSVSAMIFNSVQGGKTSSPQVHQFLQDGLNKAIAQEIQSKLQYILRKKVEEGIVQFNRS